MRPGPHTIHPTYYCKAWCAFLARCRPRVSVLNKAAPQGPPVAIHSPLPNSERTGHQKRFQGAGMEAVRRGKAGSESPET